MQYVLFNPQAGNGSGAQQARALDARFPEEADDEFPAQLQFLWDRNSMRYLTYETSFYTHRAILDRLLEADM